MREFYNINYVTSISWFLVSKIGKNFFIHFFFCFRNFSPFLLVTLALQRTIAHDKKKVLENTQYSIHVLTLEIKICNIEIKKT